MKVRQGERTREGARLESAVRRRQNRQVDFYLHRVVATAAIVVSENEAAREMVRYVLELDGNFEGRKMSIFGRRGRFGDSSLLATRVESALVL